MTNVQVRIPQEWERVIELRLGARPSEPPAKHIFVEIMGRYSNVFLTSTDMGVLACAYQVILFTESWFHVSSICIAFAAICTHRLALSRCHWFGLLRFGKTPVLEGWIKDDECKNGASWRDLPFASNSSGFSSIAFNGVGTKCSIASKDNAVVWE